MTGIKPHTIFTGDNLDVMRGMPDAFVDLIYLDPPFNSNRNYAAPIGSKAAGAAFKDAWTLDDYDAQWLGLIADDEPALAQHLQAVSKMTRGGGYSGVFDLYGSASDRDAEDLEGYGQHISTLRSNSIALPEGDDGQHLRQR